MAGYYGGQKVKEGYYLKHSTWKFESVASGGGILTGDKETKYSKIPLPIVMVAGPLMGLSYAISLPIIFCCVFGYSLARLAGQKLKIAGQKYS